MLDLIDNSLDAAMMANRRRNDIREGGEEDDDDDVAIDNDFVGRVHIYPDDVTPTSSSSSSSSSLAVVPDAAPSDSTSTKIANAASTSPPAPPPPPPSGLCIVNNSCRPIRPLKEVLEIYSSSKTDSGARDIGENGVGLKQGCELMLQLCIFWCRAMIIRGEINVPFPSDEGEGVRGAFLVRDFLRLTLLHCVCLTRAPFFHPHLIPLLASTRQ